MKTEFQLLNDKGRALSPDDADDAWHEADSWEEQERKKRESSLPPPPAMPGAMNRNREPLDLTSKAAPEPSPVSSAEPEAGPTSKKHFSSSPPPASSSAPAGTDFNAWFEQRDDVLRALQRHRESLLNELKLTEERLQLLGFTVEPTGPMREPVAPLEGLDAGVAKPKKKKKVEAAPFPKRPAPSSSETAKPAAAAKTPAKPKPAGATTPTAAGTSYDKMLALMGDKATDAAVIASRLGVTYQAAWSALKRGVARGDITMISGHGRSKTFKRKA